MAARQPKKPRLTTLEKRLLSFPPTKTTWECRAKRNHLFDQSVIVCGGVNNGKESSCWLCRSKRPAKPPLLWPLYVKACSKVGIEPGEKWKEGLDASSILAGASAPRPRRRRAS